MICQRLNICRNYMFDEQQQEYLDEILIKARRDYKRNSNVYDISAFDQKFDEELSKLVTYYSFDFESIALHLYFKFPQYSHRLKPQAVSYRWYQLTLQRDGQHIKSQILGESDKKEKQQHQMPVVGQQIEVEDQGQEIQFYNYQERFFQYQAALKMAEQLDEEQEASFMLYKPKFITDTEFKLQRKAAENITDLDDLVQNQYSMEFGLFEPPQTAPINLVFRQNSQASAVSVEQLKAEASGQEETYLDEDWQAYESD